MKYLFFINPAAGKGVLQKRLLGEIKNFFSARDDEYELIVTEFCGDAESRARKAAQTGESLRMFACGGEGTCYELLNGVFGYDNVELGVIPCGSANDFLKVFESSEPFRSLEAQISGETIPIDIIKAGDRYCINGCSVGMDAMVARDMKLFRRFPLVSGSLAYKLAIVKTFLNPKLGVTIDITVDGTRLGEKDCLFAVMGNAPFYGGGYKGAPYAHPADGMLDFTLVDTISHFKVLKFLSTYEKGEFEHLEYCRLERCESMSFTAGKAVPVNLDGEIAELKECDFSIVKNGVRFVVPTGAVLPEPQKLLTNV